MSGKLRKGNSKRENAHFGLEQKWKGRTMFEDGMEWRLIIKETRSSLG